MNKYALCFIGIFLLYSCNEPPETFRLQRDDPAYGLAELLAHKIPQLDPQLNTVLVRTNRFDITANEIIHQFQNRYGVNAPSLSDLDTDRLLSEIENTAHDLALERLMLLEAEEHHISCEKAKLDSMMSLHYNRSGSRDAFLKELAESQLSYNFFERNIRDGLIIDRLIEQVIYAQVTPPGEEEVQAMYRSARQEVVSFRHIALSVRDTSEAGVLKVRRRMEHIQREARTGKSFELLVRMYSDDESSKETGGFYENLEREMLEPIFEAAAFETPVGEVSDIFETADGLHIIKIEARGFLSYEEFRKREGDMEYQRRKAAAYQDFIKTLKEESEFKFLGLTFR